MDLNDAQQIRDLIVTPTVDAVKAEIGSLISRVSVLEAHIEQFEPRVQKLETYAGRMLKVWGGLITVGTFAAHAAWQKVKDKFHIS